MVSDRVTVALDDDTRAALDSLAERTGAGQSELVRRALAFYAANFEAAEGSEKDLAAYHELLSTGEHVLLDVDFLHALLDHAKTEDGDPDPDFLETIDHVAAFHAREYAQRFDDLGDLLDWLSVCGFLTVREAEGDTYHVTFPTEEVKWFMGRFLEESAADLPFAIDVREGVSKMLVTQVEADG